ncbi:MAG: site-specific DNA-methyltransferase, partial [Nitrosospira sp.]
MSKQPESNDPEFSLASQIAPENRSQDEVKRSAARKQTAKASTGAGEPQVISYRHADRRKNNPQVGLVNENTDPGQPQTMWRYDPHIDPALAFDIGRAQIETLIDNALASGDEAAMRAALEELKRMQSP